MKNSKGSDRIAKRETDRRNHTWLEIGAVLVLMLAPALASLGGTVLWGSGYRKLDQDRELAKLQTATAFDSSSFDSLVHRIRFVPILLVVIWRSGERWSHFGLVKPDLARDLLIGLGLWLTVAILDAIVEMASGAKHPWVALFPDALPGVRTTLLAAECCAIGFTEELGFRAYLIPRVEAATGSTRKAILFSTLIFGLAHFSKGPVGVIHATIAAFVWSIAFSSTRRIWPVAIAHSFGNFIVLTHLGAMVGTVPTGLLP